MNIDFRNLGKAAGAGAFGGAVICGVLKLAKLATDGVEKAKLNRSIRRKAEEAQAETEDQTDLTEK